MSDEIKTESVVEPVAEKTSEPVVEPVIVQAVVAPVDVKESLIAKWTSFQIIGLLFLIILSIIMVQSGCSSKSISKEQAKSNELFAEYVQADKIIAEQVLMNQQDIVKIEETVSQHENRLATLEERAKDMEGFENWMTKVNKLSVSNRNRIYAMMLKNGDPIPEAFNEDEADWSTILDRSSELSLSISKNPEVKTTEVKVEDKKVEDKKVEDKKVERSEIEAEVPKKDVVLESAPVCKRKRDYLLFIKPWKW